MQLLCQKHPASHIQKALYFALRFPAFRAGGVVSCHRNGLAHQKHTSSFCLMLVHAYLRTISGPSGISIALSAATKSA
jgi:hypothetical protein